MAKAKTNKPELATVHHVDLGLNAIDGSLALLRRAYQDNASVVAKRLSDLEGAICPRVAARLTALEKQYKISIDVVQHITANVGILDREHDELAKVVNGNSDKMNGFAERIFARLVALENRFPANAEMERQRQRQSEVRPNTWHPNGLDRLAADLRADQARAGRMTSDELHIKTILAYARKLSPAGLTQLYTQLVNQEEGI